jgi:hypothetical protein
MLNSIYISAVSAIFNDSERSRRWNWEHDDYVLRATSQKDISVITIIIREL